MSEPICSAIIVAAGSGTRFGGKTKKQFLEIQKKPILIRTIEVFQNTPIINEIILVSAPEDLEYCQTLIDKYSLSKVSAVVPGGNERQHSVYNGLCSVSPYSDIILIHDGVRPLITQENIYKTALKAFEKGGAILAVKAKDTIKTSSSNKSITNTLQRENLWQAQTPQAFKKDLLLKAYKSAIKDGFIGTDDSSLVERIGAEVFLIEGNYENIKITTNSDYTFVKTIMKERNFI